MKYRTAETEELCKLKKMYDDVIDHQSEDEYGAGWTKDVYPSRDDLERHLKEDLVYVIDDDGEFRGAGIISLHEDEMYKNAPWSRKLADEEVAVLHLFTIHPEYRGKGYAKDFLRYMILETGKTSKAIHIDVVKGNLSAFKTYERCGFHCIGEFGVWYEDTGDIIVDLMEYNY